MPKSKSTPSKLRKTRLGFQILTFFVFIGGIYFVNSKAWPFPEAVIFFTDPLVTIVSVVTTGILVPGLVLSSIMVVLTLIFGRFFCGWMCPLGALIDFTEWAFKKKPAPKMKLYDRERLALLKFGVLTFVLAASIFSVQWIYFFDPMVIMTRFLGMTTIPVERAMTHAEPFKVLYAEQFIAFVIVILLLSLAARRFWCRFICPLGALYGLLARFTIFDFKSLDCKGCPSCEKSCPTGAIVDAKHEGLRRSECIRCFKCLDSCKFSARTFGLKMSGPSEIPPVVLPRRTFLVWLTSGLAGSTVLASHSKVQAATKNIVRPPFAADEETFLDLCLRCQACVNVCPNNALQPQLFESGLYGLWSPELKPSIGGCEPECNRCSQVCPTTAIGPFEIETKYTVKMGTANLNKSLCISWSDDKACGKCIDQCPTGAISYFEEKNTLVPLAVDYMLCVGCGMCENKCHHSTLGPTAMRVTPQGRNVASGVDVEKVLKNLKEKKWKHH